MSKEKQIEEMAKVIARRSKDFRNPNVAFMTTATKTAESLYNAGYRKQSEGEWIDANPNGAVYKFACTLCGETKLGKGTSYCPNCGAKMKGGAEE